MIATSTDMSSYARSAAPVQPFRHLRPTRGGKSIYRTLSEHSPDIIVCFDAALRRTYVNPAAEKIFGCKASALVGRTPDDVCFFPPGVMDLVKEVVQRVVEAGECGEAVLEVPLPTGKRAYFHLHAIPEFDESGEVIGVLTFSRDVTSLKEAERQLEQAEAMAHLGNWQWDLRDGKCTASAETCRIFGKPQGWKPSRREIADAIVPEDRERSLAAMDSALASRAPTATFGYRIQVDDRVIDTHSSVWIDYDQVGTVSRMVGTIQDVSELKRYQQQLHSLAFYDSVTHLPNRELFNDRVRVAIGQAHRHDQEAAVLILDLDNFKSINDTLGHGTGDQILRETAVRLRQCVREYDCVARLGGDEFAFVLTDLPRDTNVGKICRKILDTIGDAYVVDGKEIYLTGSIGIARYPTDGATISDLLQHADAAMYHAKEAGRNNFQFYASSLTIQMSERLGLAARLRRAELNGELELYFQPQIDLAHGQLIGAEALLRWNHPEDGLILPDKFIQIAEETGLIVGIGQWVLREACGLAAAWNSGRDTPMKVAVNLSPRQFKTGDLAGLVKQVLAETGCAPTWLELEITESLLLDDLDAVSRTLKALHDQGVAISIDDFGTGYSALGYLNQLPVKSIKLDRSFVRHVATKRDNAELVKAIISMAQSLNLTMVAEGIEDRVQEEFLRLHGCQCGQGYLYGKPMPRRSFEALLARRDA